MKRPARPAWLDMALLFAVAFSSISGAALLITFGVAQLL